MDKPVEVVYEVIKTEAPKVVPEKFKVFEFDIDTDRRNFVTFWKLVIWGLKNRAYDEMPDLIPEEEEAVPLR